MDAPQLVAEVEPLLSRQDPEAAVAQLHGAVTRFVENVLSKQELTAKVLDGIAADLGGRCLAWLRYVGASVVQDDAHFGGSTHILVDAQRPIDSYELATGLDVTWHPIPSDGGGALLDSPSCRAQLESCLGRERTG